jgi:protein-S-isoprenylcysteine O-methyltransferase Ste14
MTQVKVKNGHRPLLPPTYLLVALLSMGAVHFIVPIAHFIPRLWNLWGLVPLGLGMVVNYLADHQFHIAETTVKPFEKSATLITGGVFNYSRNPMYLGFVMILLGVALLLGSLAPFLVIPVFITLMQQRFIRYEEQMLVEIFGQEWRKYVQKVRRWI